MAWQTEQMRSASAGKAITYSPVALSAAKLKLLPLTTHAICSEPESPDQNREKTYAARQQPDRCYCGVTKPAFWVARGP